VDLKRDRVWLGLDKARCGWVVAGWAWCEVVGVWLAGFFVARLF